MPERRAGAEGQGAPAGYSTVQAVNVLTASLLDAAYFERAVVDGLSAAPYGWDFIVCANQQCNALKLMALGQPEFLWKPTGVDTRRGGDYASAIRALYGTKQGRENDYKTALCDLACTTRPRAAWA